MELRRRPGRQGPQLLDGRDHPIRDHDRSARSRRRSGAHRPEATGSSARMPADVGSGPSNGRVSRCSWATSVGLQQEVFVGRYVGRGERRFCGTVRWTEAEASHQAAKQTGPDRDRQQPAQPAGDRKPSRPAAREDVVSPPLHQDAATLEKVRPRIRRHRLIGLDVRPSDCERSSKPNWPDKGLPGRRRPEKPICRQTHFGRCCGRDTDRASTAPTSCAGRSASR